MASTTPNFRRAFNPITNTIQKSTAKQISSSKLTGTEISSSSSSSMKIHRPDFNAAAAAAPISVKKLPLANIVNDRIEKENIDRHPTSTKKNAQSSSSSSSGLKTSMTATNSTTVTEKKITAEERAKELSKYKVYDVPAETQAYLDQLDFDAPVEYCPPPPAPMPVSSIYLDDYDDEIDNDGFFNPARLRPRFWNRFLATSSMMLLDDDDYEANKENILQSDLYSNLKDDDDDDCGGCEAKKQRIRNDSFADSKGVDDEDDVEMGVDDIQTGVDELKLQKSAFM